MPRARGVPNPANNRTDIPGKVPTMTAPDQTYGKQTAQEQSQRILPVAAAPTAGPSGAASPGGPPAGPQPPNNLPAAAPSALPGSLPWTHPPVGGPGAAAATGLPPGQGLAQMGPLGALAAQQKNEAGNLRMLLGHLASQPGASEVIKGLAQVAGATVAG